MNDIRRSVRAPSWRDSRFRVPFVGFTIWLQVACSAQVLQPAQFLPARQDVLAIYLFNGSDEATFKRQLEGRIELQIAQIIRVAQLDESQQKKLKWASEGDLSRFYRELDQLREKVKNFDVQHPNDMQQVWQLILPVQQRVHAGIIDENSLVERVLSTILSSEQQQCYRGELRERQLYRYKSILRMTIADLEKSLPLSTEQRQELIKILEGKKFPRTSPPNMDPYVGYAMLLRLNDQEAENILDAHQVKTLQQIFEKHAHIIRTFTW